MYKYTYPVTRYSELETTIQTNTPLTNEHDVMAFYKEEIAISDEHRIRLAYAEGEISDVFQYVEKNLLIRDPKLPQCTYSELMGDCQFL